MDIKMTWMQRLTPLVIYSFIAVLTVFVLLPFVWPLTSAFTPKASTFYIHRPDYLTLDNFREVIWGRGHGFTLMKNSLIYAGGAVILAIFVCSLAGYTLSRLDFRFKRVLMYAILLVQVIPSTATILPFYLVMRDMRLVNTHLGVVLGLATGQIPFTLWVMKGFFDMVPIEIEEAAWLDGANRFQALFRIVFPLALPGVGAVSVLAFNSTWAAFFLPFIMLSSADKFPLSLGLFRAIVAYTYVDYGFMNAMALMYMVPSFICFLLARRYLIRATMAGALAGS